MKVGVKSFFYELTACLLNVKLGKFGMIYISEIKIVRETKTEAEIVTEKKTGTGKEIRENLILKNQPRR